MAKPRTDHARLCSALALMPALFSPGKRGSREAFQISSYAYGETMSFAAGGPARLGGDDARILQAICALASMDGSDLPCPPANAEQADLREELQLSGRAKQAGCWMLRTQSRQVAIEAGYARPSSGAMHAHIRSTLMRLSEVTITERSNGALDGYQLLAFVERGGDFVVALNPRLSIALVRERAKHTRVSLNEARQLRSEIARLVHQRLSAVMDPGSERVLLLETLVARLYPSEASGSTLSMRRNRVRSALKEVADAAGWSLAETARDRFKMKRPGSRTQSPTPRNNSEKRSNNVE